MTQQLNTVYTDLQLGCDPEFFFAQDGKVIGAEKVLPSNGILAAEKQRVSGAGAGGIWDNPKAFVLDGVQVELNPKPTYCRAHIGNQLRVAFIALKEHLNKVGEGKIKASFSSVIEIDQRELDGLSEKAKVFGCAPSLNQYDKGATVSVDAATYLKRSAGGHIHLGLEEYLKPLHARLVPLMDIIVGNTCVMIDRDPEAATRRLHYGRAGEHRLPKHGLEYRTLSNFWLRSYPLVSLVLGLSRLAVGVLKTTTIAHYSAWDAETDLLKRVDMANITKAINTNDLKLAKDNWNGVREFIKEHCTAGLSGYGSGGYPLNDVHLPAFDFFLKKIEESGLEYWFPDDPMEHWTSITEGHYNRWETFLSKDVKTQLEGVL
jgi:hypothetical protein